ncbi:hypothetical protein [Actinophytocola sp. KF-1]
MPEQEHPENAGTSTPASLDIGIDELLEALNDLEKAQALMAERGWTSKDLVARAEALNKWLVESMAAVNVV